jgi:hypothetical protein
MQIADNDRNIPCFIEALLRQEQRSKHYQGELESRIHSDAVELQRSRAYTLQLQRMVHGLQHQRSQLETSLAHMAESCRVMARDVGLEKTKVQELESRLAEECPNIDSLLQYFVPIERNCEHLNDEGVNGHILLENQRQRELIMSLESSLRDREEAIREMKSRLEETVQELYLAGHAQHQSDQLTPDEMTGSTSEESSIEIITANPSLLLSTEKA